MTTPRAPRIAVISHDWSTATGAGRCAVELRDLLGGSDRYDLPLDETAIPPRRSGRRHVASKVLRALAVARALRRHKIDVVVVNTTVQATIVAASRLAGCRVVWWCHESEQTLSPPIMRARLFVYRTLAHYQVTVSRSAPQAQLPHRMVRNIVNVEPHFPHQGHSLLVLGTKCLRKGTDLLPDLLDPRRLPNHVTLDVVGWEDPREQAVLSETRSVLEQRWGRRFRWRDIVADPDDAYRGAAVLLLPSREDPRPRVVDEALARGIPVVASELPGLIDTLEQVADPHALHLVVSGTDWHGAVDAALAMGTSSDPYITASTPQEFLAAWDGILNSVLDKE